MQKLQRRILTLFFSLALVAAGAPLLAQTGMPPMVTFTETFSAGSNDGGWTFGNSFDAIQPDGGNPGAYLRNDLVDSFAPLARTTLSTETVFHGDYRALEVSRVGIDLRLFAVDFTAAGRPLSLILRHDSGTPEDFSDDCRVAFTGNRQVPQPNQPWLRYTFRIPSDSTTLPRGWTALELCAGQDADGTWNQVITGVDQLGYLWADPELFYIFQVWDVGMDNPEISYGS